MMSIIHLRSLLSFKLQELIKRDREFSRRWIEEKKCECVALIREGITINCKHYQEGFKEEYKGERKAMHRVSAAIIKIELSCLK